MCTFHIPPVSHVFSKLHVTNQHLVFYTLTPLMSSLGQEHLNSLLVPAICCLQYIKNAKGVESVEWGKKRGLVAVEGLR